MNSVVLIGRLTRDPEIRYTASTQMAVVTFTIAIDRPVRSGGEKQADFPRITVFGRQAENCERYLAKGRLVGVQGRLQTGSYQNKDGVTVYTTDVVADRVEFLEWGDRNQSGSAPRQNASSNYGGQGGYGQQGGYGNQQQGGYAPQQSYGGGQGGYSQPEQNYGGGQSSYSQPQQSDGMPEEMPDSFQAIDEDVPF